MTKTFFSILRLCFFLIFQIKNNNIEKEKKLMKVKLYGENPRIVIAPNKNGTKNTVKNLLFRM